MYQKIAWMNAIQIALVLSAAFLLTGCFPLSPDMEFATPTSTATPTIIPPTPTRTPIVIPTRTPLPYFVCTIEWVWIEDKLQITAVDPTRADGLMRGDQVLRIEGIPVEDFLKEVEKEFDEISDDKKRRERALEEILTTSDGINLIVKHEEEPWYFYYLEPGCHK